MRDKMRQLEILSEMLDNASSDEERDQIQEEIWNVEEEMEFYDDYEYKNNHHKKFSDI